MTPLVLIPGMMCDARLFAPQTAALSGFRPLHHAPLTGRSTVDELAGDILEHAPPRFALAGLSMGGIVAMEILRQSPERVERIALLDTNPLAEQDEVKSRRKPQLEAVAAGRLSEVMRDEMKPNYLARGPARQGILDLCMEMALGLGARVFEQQSHALMTRRDQCDTLRSITIPAWVLCGREDLLCPVERHELMAGLIPGSTLELIDGAGHLPTLEQPESTNAALMRWLAAR